MEGAKTEQILIYPPYMKEQIQEYSKRLPIAEFKTIDAQRIKTQFNILQKSNTPFESNAFYIQQDKNKERYSDIITYNHNRVKCQHITDFYLNASQMRSVLDNKVYAIFAQAPVKKVVENFWIACYHYSVKKIIMLCSFQDPHRGKQAEKYWPQLGETINFESKITIKCESEEQIDADCVRTIIIIKGQKGEKKIEHIHWTGWADMKKPLGEKNQILFQNLVEDCLSLIEKGHMFLVHCSAGIGRTGTLGTMIEAIRCARQKKRLSIFQIVDNIRRHRMQSVQTLDQYKFVYQTLLKIL